MNLRAFIHQIFDLREGEVRPVLRSFLVLFLLIGAHTMLETARDALFLTSLPPKQLNLVYIALAGLSFFAAAGSTRLAARFGRRNALVGTLCIAAFTTVLLHSMTATPRVVMGLYVFSGLVGAVLSPQFWLVAAQTFTSAQGRRLFGPIASGGVIGGVAGASTAALLLARFPVTSLLLAAAFAFVGTALLLTTLEAPVEEEAIEQDAPASGRTSGVDKSGRPSLTLGKQPFVWRVALLVGISTAAVLTVDYLFKSTAARTIPAAELGQFFARYYAVMNGVSLLVQLVLAGRVVRRVGVAAATGVMPSLLMLGGIGSFLTGGAFVPVLATRLVDGGLRHSLNRVATELLYLPMPTAVRERAKGLIDTVLARAVQATTAGSLYALGMLGILSPRFLAAIVLALAVAWMLAAVGLRKPYLDLFRGALARGTLQLDTAGTEIDVNGAEALVEAMASPDPRHVIAALDVLEQRHRDKLIPALILYHDSDAVLSRALEIFGASPRVDWIPLGERLLSHGDVAVRVAAVRALAKHGVASALVRAADDASPTVQGYAAYHLALGAGGALTEDPRVVTILATPGEVGDAARRVLLTAIADTPDPRAVPLVLAIAESKMLVRSEVNIVMVARAMEALPDPRYIPFCIAQLAARPARDEIRRALVAMGDPALEALEATLDRDPEAQERGDRRVRVHVPWTIAEFGSQRACDFLMARLGEEGDGFVRYKVLRALGHIVATRDVKVDRAKIEEQARRTLLAHLQVTALKLAIERGRGAGAESLALELLIGLLANKESQSLERAFRLLKIAHRSEDIHRVHNAALSKDRQVRSNAGEFLDTLLAGRPQRELRGLFRLVIDDLTPAERVARAAPILGPIPATRDEALAALIADPDEGIATIASYYALSIGEEKLRASVDRARRDRPSLASLMERFSMMPPLARTAG